MRKILWEKPDRNLREQFRGRERQNESHSGEERNIYSLRRNLRGREAKGAADLCRKEIVMESWEERLLEILKSKVSAEGIVLLSLGNKRPQGSIHLFWTNKKKKLPALPYDFKYEQKISVEGNRLQYVTTIVPKNMKLQINE